MTIGNQGRPCSVCTSKHRNSVDARLAAGKSFRRVATAFGLGESSLKRHKTAGHVAEAERAAASATANAREVSERVAEHDRKLSEMSFAGDLRQQAETLRDHGISLMRRAESRGDERSAIAAGSMVQRALEMLTAIKMKETAKAAADEVPLVIITEPGFRVPDWLSKQVSGRVWLPDNGRGDGPVAHLFSAPNAGAPDEPLSEGAILPADEDYLTR